jgi:hypothetical protein
MFRRSFVLPGLLALLWLVPLQAQPPGAAVSPTSVVLRPDCDPILEEFASAQNLVSSATAMSPAWDDTDPEIEWAWLLLGGSFRWIVFLRWPG